ncbi:MAG: FtsX-like permease family protein [bacterium]|nr:FtsX-like permease family protein [bacterium]
MVESVKQAIWRVDKDQPVFRIRTMADVLSEARVTTRLTMVLLGVFATLALIMAAVGVYGVMSYSVSQRRQEIGVRIAMGARSSDVFSLVVRKGLLLGAAGVAAGSVAAFILTRVIASLLYGVSATEPLTFVAVAVLLIAVSGAACYLPARRATRVDPVNTLRYE